MKLNETFVQMVASQVEQIRADYPGVTSDGDAFAVWATSFLNQVDLEQAIESCQTSGALPGDGGVDGVLVDERDEMVYVTQAKFSQNAHEKSFDDGPASELLLGLARLRSSRHSTKLGGSFAEKAVAFRAAVEGGADCVARVVVWGEAKQSLHAAVEAIAAEDETGHLQGEVWDAARLAAEWVVRTTTDDLEGHEVRFALASGVPVSTREDWGVAGLERFSIALLDGASVAEVAKTFGARLVDLNVRYQLRRTKINDSIAKTAITDGLQDSFLLLNNGLTILCDNLEQREGAIVLRNPQIVNGAQTALTLADNEKDIPPQAVSVLARIVQLDLADDRSRELARSISEATNRQNPVSSADLKAHDPLQVRIEADLKSLTPPWYYERRRNSWASVPQSERKAFAGHLNKEDVGQRYRAMLGEPARAITSKGAVFDSTSLYGEIFSEDIPVQKYVLAHELFGFYQGMLVKGRADLRQEVYSEFNEELRALIIKARNQFASHATALTYHLLVRRYGQIETERCIEIAADCGTGGKAYMPVHQLSCMTIIKWALSLQEAARATGGDFSIRHELQQPEAYPTMREDANMTAQFLRAQTLDRLPA